MIKLFDKGATNFNTLGIGVLTDVTSALVTEELNGEFEFEFEYPLNGKYYEYVVLNNIVVVKPNPYANEQAFRIYSISRPINGIVKVNAQHISYDMSGYIVDCIDSTDGIQDVLTKIQNGVVGMTSPFRLTTDLTSKSDFKTERPYSMRSLLAGQDGSVLDRYHGEYKFDNFLCSLLKQRGSDKGVEIRYSKNMTDLNQSTDNSNLVTGVYPLYYQKTTETITTSKETYQQAYIVGDTPFASNWLALTEGGSPFLPIVQNVPIQIASEGAYKGKIYCYDLTQLKYIETPTAAPTIVQSVTEQQEHTYKIDLPEKIIYLEGYSAQSDLKRIMLLDLTSMFGQNEGTLQKGYNHVYIVGDTPYAPDWLSSSQGGEPFVPTTDHVPVQIRTNGEHLNEIVCFNPDTQLYYQPAEGSPDREPNVETNEYIPTEEQLREKANKYISENKLGEIKENIQVSFYDFLGTDEYKDILPLMTIELGDTVKIVYNELGISASKEVIKTEYDPLTDKYAKVTLGEKSSTLSDTVITSSDGVSSLYNDKDYADTTTIKNIIANTVKAEYIEASEAHLSKAQISDLQVSKFRCSGIIEASGLDIDSLVAKKIYADDAQIKTALIDKIRTTELNADMIKSGTIDADDVTIRNINANYITSGVIDANEVAVENINATNITSGTLSANFIKGGYINGSDVSVEGNLLAKTIIAKDMKPENISSDNAFIDSLNSRVASSRIINVGDLYIGSKLLGEATTSSTKTATFTATKTSSSSAINITVTSKVGSSLFNVPENTLVDVTVSYRAAGSDGSIYNTTVTVSIPIQKGHSSASRGIQAKNATSIVIDSVSPSSKEFDVEESDSNAVFIGSSFIPAAQAQGYCLGSPSYKWDTVYSASGTINTSDRNEKKEISYDLTEYDGLLDKLKPAKFKMVKGTSGRYHTGFISQDVKDSLDELSIDDNDFACYVHDKETDAYGLRYSELHALEVLEIQKLKKEIAELKSTINKLL